MATPISSLLKDTRNFLVDAGSRRFWSDDELISIMTKGAKDLWGSILNTYSDHYLSIDTEHVTLEASADALNGVPDDVFRVHLIEPLDTTQNGIAPNLRFVPKKYNSQDFIIARSLSALDPASAGVIFYDVSGVGAPNGAPTILTAPRVSSQTRLRFVYNPTLPPLHAEEPNPIAGESDMALVTYTVAFARAKDNDSRQPDAGWLAVYASEKQNILSRITPRQDQEPEVVEGLFDELYY